MTDPVIPLGTVLPPGTAPAPRRNNVIAFPLPPGRGEEVAALHQRAVIAQAARTAIANWQLTEKRLAAVDDAIEAEHQRLRQKVMELIERRKARPVYLAAALLALADVAARVIDEGQILHHRQAVRPEDRLRLEAYFSDRLQHELRWREARAAARRG